MTETSTNSSIKKIQFPLLWLLLILITLFTCFAQLGALDYTDLDEGYYASVSANMARSGDFVTPHFGGEAWWEKPPMLYWNMAACYKILGYSEAAGRIPSAMAMFITFLLTAWFAYRLFGEKTALYSSAIISTSLFFLIQSHLATTDGLLTLFLTVSFSGLYFYAVEGTKRAFYVASLACGLAMLTKGPVAPGFFVILAGLIYWQIRESRTNLKNWRVWLVGALFFFLVVSPWYGAVLHQHGAQFFKKFIWEQNIGRLTGGDSAHNLPFWGAALYFLAGFFPWSFFIFTPILYRERSNEEKFLWCWFLLVFVFFSISRAKLPNYLLPLYPAAAILIGRKFANKYENVRSLQYTFIFIAVFLFLSFIIIFFRLTDDKQLLYEGILPQIKYILLGNFLISSILLCYTIQVKRITISFKVIMGQSIIIWLALIFGGSYYNEKNVFPVHQLTRDAASNDLCLYNLHPGFPSVEFYHKAPFHYAENIDSLKLQKHANKPMYVIAEIYLEKGLQDAGLQRVESRGKYILMVLK